jgi:hypothetical protein
MLFPFNAVIRLLSLAQPAGPDGAGIGVHQFQRCALAAR